MESIILRAIRENEIVICSWLQFVCQWTVLLRYVRVRLWLIVTFTVWFCVLLRIVKYCRNKLLGGLPDTKEHRLRNPYFIGFAGFVSNLTTGLRPNSGVNSHIFWGFRRKKLLHVNLRKLPRTLHLSPVPSGAGLCSVLLITLKSVFFFR